MEIVTREGLIEDGDNKKWNGNNFRVTKFYRWVMRSCCGQESDDIPKMQEKFDQPLLDSSENFDSSPGKFGGNKMKEGIN